MKITLVQSRGHIDDPEANYGKTKMRVGPIDADLFIFPEMYMCGYVSVKEKMHTKIIEGRVLAKYKEYSQKRDSVIVMGGPQTDGDKVYNSLYYIDKQDVKTYRKIHLSSNGVAKEKELYSAGNEPLCVEHKGLKFGFAISHDLYFPEMFRWYAANDVDIMVVIAAVPENTMKDYEKLLVARAVENSMYVAFVNMVGPDPGVPMVGGSKFISPTGEILENCSDSSDVREIRIDENDIKEAKKNRFAVKETRKDVNWKF